jgi:hypothetical protein
MAPNNPQRPEPPGRLVAFPPVSLFEKHPPQRRSFVLASLFPSIGHAFSTAFSNAAMLSKTTSAPPTALLQSKHVYSTRIVAWVLMGEPATPEELEDERRRWERATRPAPIEGNLCACLVMLARWCPCCVCGSLTLYANERARTDGDFECGVCVEIRETLAKRLRPSLPLRAALHLRTLFSTANDNHEARA